MRRDEARIMSEWVDSLHLEKGAVCLNIGSSTRTFRTQLQPHVEDLFIRPMEESGIRVVHCDMKAADGVDEVGDVLDPEFRARLRRYDADLLVCSNLFEHLVDPQSFALACGELVRPGGYGLFTMPLSYPYHADPIDTGLRLKPDELAALLPGWEVLKAEQIKAGNHLRDLRESKRGWKLFASQLVRTALPFYRRSQWKGIAHRLLWLFRPYRQSMVLLRKPA